MMPRLPHKGLASRLRRIVEILDKTTPETEHGMVALRREAAQALEQIARNDLSRATSLLGKVLRANPLWIRGYLLLATIYQYTQAMERAIVMLESGINICQISLRHLSGEICRPLSHGALNPKMRARILRRVQLLIRYERMLRHQLAVILLQTGRFQEAIELWPEREDIRYA